MAKCDCYFQHGTKFLCYGTKEREECSCGGDESKCNFYPEKRKLKMANEKRLIDANALKANFVVLGEFAKDLWHAGTIRSSIDNAPTVDAVEVVHGRWIAVPSSDMMTGKAYKCSECNKMRYGSYMPNYCQFCGAKMDGDGNG